MRQFYLVTTSNGDGTTGLRWVVDDGVIAKMKQLADSGNETFASGDGLQVTVLSWPDDSLISLEEWFKLNHISLTTLEDMEEHF